MAYFLSGAPMSDLSVVDFPNILVKRVCPEPPRRRSRRRWRWRSRSGSRPSRWVSQIYAAKNGLMMVDFGSRETTRGVGPQRILPN